MLDAELGQRMEAALIERAKGGPMVRPVVGFPGYYITVSGALWSARLYHGSTRLHKMHPALNRDKYFGTLLYRDGRAHSVKIHRLVALAFLGQPRPGQRDVRHLDGNKANNHASNLAYGTRLENVLDSVRLGRTTAGSKAKAAKLREHHIAWIMAYRAAGYRIRAIAEAFLVSPRVIGGIVRGEAWTHVAREAL